jgi:hypothetical protein
MVVRSARVLGGPVLELTGEWRGRAVPVELVGEAHPVTLDGQAFTVRLPWRPGRLRAAVPLVIEAEGAWLRDGRELVLDRGGELIERPARDYPRRIAREVPSTSPPAPSASTAT